MRRECREEEEEEGERVRKGERRNRDGLGENLTERMIAHGK